MGFLQCGVLCKAVPGVDVLPLEQGEADPLPVPPAKLRAGKPRALAAWRSPGNLGLEAAC